MTPQRATLPENSGDFQAILATMQLYVDGGRTGRSEFMRPAFHPAASFVGHHAAGLITGSIDQLFSWVDANGPAPSVKAEFVSVDVIETIAVVRLEVSGWSGKLAGESARMSDLFTLLKMPEGWVITEKTFHWHTTYSAAVRPR